MAVAASTTTRRNPRRVQEPVDVTAFTPRVQRALTAFRSDVSYAVLMARAAVTIERKRAGWQQQRTGETI